MAEEVPKPLLYRPPQAWYFWSAFGAALAIHLTAVALAQKHEAPVEVPPDIPTCVVEVGSSGRVSSASMGTSIGSPILDNAATSAFSQWRFKPGSVSKVKIPITFTMTGAQY